MNNTQTTLLTISIIFGLSFLIGGGMYGYPKYSVYSQTLKGTAELARAEQNRQILINEAKAGKESAKYQLETMILKAKGRATADSIRAEGTAKANRIIAKSLSDKYIRWKFVDELGDTKNRVIYVPTETQIPITEAGKR